MKVVHAIAVAVVAMVLCAAAIPLIGHGGSSDRDAGPTPIPDPEGGYPEGVSVDKGSCTISYSEETSWNVYDLFETYYVKPEGTYTWSLYEGSDHTGSSITLGPGYYRVTVDGSEFDVGFAGYIERTASWDYDIDGTAYPVSVTYSIDVGELVQKKEVSREYNRDCADTSTPTKHQFSDLPGLIDVNATVASLEGSMRSEFERIGGDAADRQAYADFLASFPQVAVPYPPSIYPSGMAGRAGEDYGTYGMDEYWACPLETLCIQYGDCEDTAVLLCSLYAAAGYETAAGGISGHVFAGVALDVDGFVETSKSRMNQLDRIHGNVMKLAKAVPVEGSCDPPLSETTFFAVETIYTQLPVGYLTSGSKEFGKSTYWGTSGFYPYQGAESGIQGSS